MLNQILQLVQQDYSSLALSDPFFLIRLVVGAIVTFKSILVFEENVKLTLSD
jgi:hypothetical protein